MFVNLVLVTPSPHTTTLQRLPWLDIKIHARWSSQVSSQSMAQISHCFVKLLINYNSTMQRLSMNQKVLQHSALVSVVASSACFTWRLSVSVLSANQISHLSQPHRTWCTQSQPVITSYLQLPTHQNIQMARSRRLKSQSFAQPCLRHQSSSEQSWSSAKSAVESYSAWTISLKIA